MPNYVQEVKKKLNYQQKLFPHHSPHNHLPVKYGVKGSKEYHVELKNDHLLPTNKTKPMQSIVGKCQYYARAIDNTMLEYLNGIATTQAKPTKHTEEECQKLQDYAYTCPNVHVRFCASDVVLWKSDAAYLVLPKARSRIAGYFRLSNNPERVTHPTIDGAMSITRKALRPLVSTSAESETTGIFINAQQALPSRHAPISLNHPQPPTPLKTGNSITHGFVHNNM